MNQYHLLKQRQMAISTPSTLLEEGTSVVDVLLIREDIRDILFLDTPYSRFVKVKNNCVYTPINKNEGIFYKKITIVD